MSSPKIKDCFPLVNGIWSKINYEFPDVFEVDSSQLDIMFLSNWGLRTPAPIIRVIHDDTVQLPLSSEELETLAGIINGMFKHKWDKLMNVAMMEYDPIHNYSDNLSETINYTEEEDTSKTLTGSNSSTRTDNLQEQQTDARQSQEIQNLTEQQTDARSINETRNLTNSGNDSRENGIYGFNSSTAVGDNNTEGSNSNTESGSIVTSHSGNLTTTNTGTDTTTHSGTLTTANTGTQSSSGSISNSEQGDNDKSGERTREYTKTGNIGNISTQKLLNEELELWKYNFILEVMRDVANFVSLPIYEQ